MIEPTNPGIVNVAVASIPFPDVVNATFAYVPAVYPEPEEVIVPSRD